MGSVLYLDGRLRRHARAELIEEGEGRRARRGAESAPKPSSAGLQLLGDRARRARRVHRRRKGVLRGVLPRRAARAALDHHPRLGLQQPDAPALRPGAEGRAAGAARRVPQLPRPAPPRPARLHPQLGLPDGVRHRPRVPAALRPRAGRRRGACTCATTTRTRSAAASTRRSWSSTTRSRSSAASTSPCGAGTAASTRPTIRAASRREALSAVPRRDDRGRRRRGAPARRARARALAPRHRRAPAAGRRSTSGSMARRARAGRHRRRGRHRPHAAAARRAAGGARGREALPRHDRGGAPHASTSRTSTSPRRASPTRSRSASPSPTGPEVVLVLRLLSHGWLEEHTMHVLRTRLIQRLRAGRPPRPLPRLLPARPGAGRGQAASTCTRR